MSFNVWLTDDAVRDFVEICDYLDQRESPERADYVFTRIERALNSLSEHPQRGSYPKELLDLGIREYREIFFKPFQDDLPRDARQCLRAAHRRWQAGYEDIAGTPLAALVGARPCLARTTSITG